VSDALRRAADARPWVWGHRGARRELPENALPAFERALAHGADGVELDVRPCRSGEIVVCHDRDLTRVAGDDRLVADLDWAALSAVELAGGGRVPLLEEALDLVLAAGKAVNVEIKKDVEDLEGLTDAVARLLSGRGADERARVTVSSFAWAAVERFAAAGTGVAAGFLCQERSAAERPLPSGWGLHPRADLVSPAFVERLRSAGHYVATWTVNDPADIRRVAAAGVDIVITDDVPAALAALGA